MRNQAKITDEATKKEPELSRCTSRQTSIAVKLLQISQIEMALNFSRLQDSWCRFLPASNSDSSSVSYQVTLTTCVITSLLAPTAVVGNALIMAAIWKNPSLRTPSYVLLAGLAFTDFSTGLLTQPIFVTYQIGRLVTNRKMYCVAGVILKTI